MTVAVTCTALLGLLLFGLSCAVTAQRRGSKTYFAYKVDPEDLLYRLVRAHGNTAEYSPMLSVLMLLAVERSPAPWIPAMVGVVTACRYLQVLGMLVGPTMNRKPNLLRLVGTAGTYLGGFALCAAILSTL